MTRLVITVDNTELRAILTGIQERAGDMSLVMKSVAATLLDAVEENFKNESSPGFVTSGIRMPGIKWQELSPVTIALREKAGAWPGKMLQVSGQLAGSVATSYGPTSARAATNKVYAAIQNFGGWAGRNLKVYIPARPFMAIGNADVVDIAAQINAYLTKGTTTKGDA